MDLLRVGDSLKDDTAALPLKSEEFRRLVLVNAISRKMGYIGHDEAAH
jgi:hypothetical protein